MKKTKYLAPVLALGMTFGFGAGSVSAEKTTVTFDKGDTLWSIAQQYEDVSVNDLYEWNPGIDAHNIQIGSEISFQTGEDTADDMPNEVFHTVTPGSTLTSIANLHAGVTLKDLYDLNPGIEPRNLQPGQEVRVSRSDGYSKEFHTVRPGSTLTSIANLHAGVTVEDLYDLNTGVDARNLQIGSEIRVK
ncbi:LysM peptidoglycan-binding domain-containing protein [Halobacillus halophilus]|uniref:LysM peptidoglycan-binding domain-containing protein n=1 Tax=Halobacillus halophilus TaxID=1570 RepID=UPI001CD2858E|nr:LysM peptidoglycan-binding domain-containing protein [Halobacillus halophilus]MCA1010356.1 LysM peptidoglycan-binding domain-containing protein [Halobacillus halophilus]